MTVTQLQGMDCGSKYILLEIPRIIYGIWQSKYMI